MTVDGTDTDAAVIAWISAEMDALGRVPDPIKREELLLDLAERIVARANGVARYEDLIVASDARSSQPAESPAANGDHGKGGKIKLPRQKRRRKGPREIRENITTTRAFIRKIGEKFGNADPEDLLGLRELEAEIGITWSVAVHALRGSGRSDAEIAKVLGITRQAVSQRWPH